MKIKKLKILLAAFCLSGATFPAMAQFDLKEAISGTAKTVKAVTLTDEQIYMHPDLDSRIQRMKECAVADGIEKPENKMPEEE